MPQTCRQTATSNAPSAIKAAALLIGLCSALSAPAAPLELWMFTSPECAACAQFEREVGRSYVKTAEARLAPLHRQPLAASRPESLKAAGPVIGTPTFVLMENGREQGRIEGYSSDELFWMRLTALLGERNTQGK